MQSKNTDTSSKASFPLLADCSAEQLIKDLMLTHGTETLLSASEAKCIEDSKLLFFCLSDLLLFNFAMVYEILGYPLPASRATTYLSRYKKKDYINSVRLPVSIEDIRTVYYLTKTGYAQAASGIGCSSPFRSKAGQRLSETALQDYGTSCAFLSLVRTPFYVSVTYDPVLTVKGCANPTDPTGKESFRPDALFRIQSQITEGDIYLEHDTGNRALNDLIGHLSEYHAKGVLNHAVNGRRDRMSPRSRHDCILYTFRKNGTKNPECFTGTKIDKLLSFMSDEDTVTSISNSEFATLLDDLKRWTPAFRAKWSKRDLTDFRARLSERIDPSYVRYQKYGQRAGSASRRNMILRTLSEEYEKGTGSPFYPAITEMMHGFSVGYVAYNCVDRLLPFYYSEDYPQFKEWIISVLTPYYGSVQYWEREMVFESNMKEGETICMPHVFYTGTEEYVSVEYVSGDLSGAVRMNALLHNFFDYQHIPVKCVFVVDSYKDADALLLLLNPIFRMGESILKHGGLFDFVFLNINGDYLYTITQEGRERRIEIDED